MTADEAFAIAIEIVAGQIAHHAAREAAHKRTGNQSLAERHEWAGVSCELIMARLELARHSARPGVMETTPAILSRKA